MKRTILILAAILAVGLSGGAVAAKKITSSDIRNNTITSRDVRNGTLTLRDFKSSERTKLRGAAGPLGPQGPQGAPGASGAAGAPGRNGLTDIIYVDGPVVSVAPGGADFAQAFCPAGRIATGASEGPESGLTDIENIFVGPGGSTIIGVNNSGVTEPLQARAACAK